GAWLESLTAALPLADAIPNEGGTPDPRWADAIAGLVEERRAELADLAPWAAMLPDAAKAAEAVGLAADRRGRWSELLAERARPVSLAGLERDLPRWREELTAWEQDWPAADGGLSPPALLKAAAERSTAPTLAAGLRALAAESEV